MFISPLVNVEANAFRVTVHFVSPKETQINEDSSKYSAGIEFFHQSFGDLMHVAPIDN